MTDQSWWMTALKAASATVLAAVVALFGGWSQILTILCVLMAADYGTGLAAAFRTRTVSSRVGTVGLLKKAVILLVIMVAAQVDRLTGGDTFRDCAALFYIANEGLSILENLGRLGVPIPKALARVFAALKEEQDS